MMFLFSPDLILIPDSNVFIDEKRIPQNRSNFWNRIKCFLRLYFNTSSLIFALECQASCSIYVAECSMNLFMTEGGKEQKHDKIGLCRCIIMWQRYQ